MGGLVNGGGQWAAKGNVCIYRKRFRFPVALLSQAPLTLATGWPLTLLPAAEKTWQKIAGSHKGDCPGKASRRQNSW